ncbi:MAG: portal protein [Plesiomonas shigelloides]
MTDLKTLHTEAKSRISMEISETLDQRRFVTEQRRFVDVPGAQWEGSTNAGTAFDDGKFDKYPRFEVNRVAKECSRIISEYRNNRIRVRFRPQDGEASEALAERLNGKFRANWEENGGRDSADNAVDAQVKGGMGCIRLDTKLVDELDIENEDREIVFKRVEDAERCVFFDPNAKEYDKSDAAWAVEVFAMSAQSYEDEYGLIPSSVPVDTMSQMFDWCPPDVVYIARYYYVKVEPTTLQSYRSPITGEISTYDDEEIKDVKEELEMMGAELVKERKVKVRRIYCGLMNGESWIDDPVVIPFDFIPLIPFYGHRTIVDGIERLEGHAGKAMDAQRLENLMASMLADTANQSSGDGIPIVDIDMIPGALGNAWADRNIKRPAFLPMKSLKDKAGNVVSAAQVSGYTQPTQISPAMAALLQFTGTAVQQITGSNQLESIPSNIATETVNSIFNRMDTAAFIHMDNVAKSMRHIGRVWISGFRKLNGSDKPTRVLNQDGSDDMVLMSEEIVDQQTGNVVKLNDLSVGKYQVTVDVGQSFAARRDATVKTLIDILKIIPPTDPKYSAIAGVLAVNIDGEGLEGLKKHIRKELLLSGIEEPRTEEEKAEVAQAQQAAQSQPDPLMVQAMAQQQLAEAETIKAQTQMAKVQVDAFKAQSQNVVDNSAAALNMAKAQDISNDQVRAALNLLGQFLDRQTTAAGQMINQ